MKTTMQKRIKKQILAMTLSLAMIGTSLDVSMLAFAAQAVSENSIEEVFVSGNAAVSEEVIAEEKQSVVQPEKAVATHDLSEGSVTLTDACGSSCPGHVITGSYVFNKNGLYNETHCSTDYINVASGTHNITLQDVTIDYSLCNNNGYTSIIKCCFSVASGATANVTLSGTNTMNSGWYAPGIRACEGGTLNILGGTGVLNVYGGGWCAGIGGAVYQKDSEGYHTDQTGKITIAGGTIHATGGTFGAGIGTGWNVSDCDVTITGGTIYAIGGEWGAGIGTGAMQSFIGDNTTGCVIRIGGGNICAVGDTVNLASNMGLGRTADCSLSLTNVSASAPANVYAVNLTLSGVADGTEIASIAGLVSYGYKFNDVKTIGEKVCVYVTAGKTITSVTTKNGQVFTGSVTASASTEVSGVFFVDEEPESNPTITLSDDLILGQSGDKLTYVMGNTSGAYTGTLKITAGSRTDCNIGVIAGAHDIALDGVEIDLQDITSSRKMAEGSPLYVMSGASVNVTLIGTTTLTAGTYAAAVQVVSGAKITFGGNGKLHAKNMAGYYDFDSDGYGAVIGAGYEGGCGEVVINSGNLYLRNNGSGAGIGGGGINSQYAGGTVTINGGNVNVEVSKDDAQKIGYGSNGAINSDIPDAGTLKNGAGETLYLSEITLSGLDGTGGDISATGTIDYNLDGMQVMEGKLCMYLPAGETITTITVGDQTFSGTLTTKTSETSAVFKTANIPTVNNPVVNLDANLILSKEGSDLYYQCDDVYCKYTGTVTVTGNTNEYGILAESGVHKVVLDNVNIDQRVNSSGKVIDISGGATLDLVLKGENKLYSHDKREAIRVPSAATLKVSGDGSLDVIGQPAIGCFEEVLGTIIINSGTIYATGEFGSAAIGTGYVAATGGGSITINGGTISAIAGEYSAAIGTGGASYEDYNEASAVNIVITGGNLYAKGSTYDGSTCDDIGNGNGGSGTTVCNTNGKSLVVTELTLAGVTAGDSVSAITISSGTYSVTGMKVLAGESSTEGKVYVYLPSGVSVIGIVAGGLTYSVTSGYAGQALTATHAHAWSYSASGDTLTAVCTSTVGTCSAKKNTVTIVAPNEAALTYDGGEKAAYLTGNIPGETLSIIYKKLNGSTWIAMTGSPIDAGTYRACVTLGSCTAYVEYTIWGSDAEITVLPTADTLTYEQTLSQSKLIGGEARKDGKVISGSFAWESPNTKPTVQTAANTGYKVVFTPDDTNIAPITVYVKFAVNKAQIPSNKPASAISTKYVMLKYVELPTGWTWKSTDLDKKLVAGNSVTFTAEYTATDKDNYVTTTADVKVTKLACTHSWDSGVVIKASTALETGIRQHTCTICKDTKNSVIEKLPMPKKGNTYTADDGLAKYKVTKAGTKKGTVEYVKPIDKKVKVVVIPATVKINGVTYKVTSVAKNAFKKNKYITTLTIGKNVKKIGKNAFYKCSKLKKITIKTTKLTLKSVGKNAFKGIYKKAKIKVPKKKLKAYKKMLLKRGVGEKAQITK